MSLSVLVSQGAVNLAATRNGGATFVDASSVGIAGLTLTGPGKRLYDLMELHAVPPEARR